MDFIENYQESREFEKVRFDELNSPVFFSLRCLPTKFTSGTNQIHSIKEVMNLHKPSKNQMYYKINQVHQVHGTSVLKAIIFYMRKPSFVTQIRHVSLELNFTGKTHTITSIYMIYATRSVGGGATECVAGCSVSQPQS